ncbi:MAG: hydrogenase nickel incorporation protein HypB [Bacteroidales bacterium]|nr:hydrogenase nickel incorporation protein HypB [Bacteroidales bacterium]
MCNTCGCGESNNQVKYQILDSDNEKHLNLHDNTHVDSYKNDHHNHEHSHRSIEIQEDILNKNKLIAERNRGYFEAKNIITLNFVSAPGAGKTSLLIRTINALKTQKNIFVIEGDQESLNDANKIKATDVPVIQVNTGNGCHLDSTMINNAIKKLNITDNSFLFIENVGNLVCPSLFDLGEKYRILIYSVTEGDDKPIKYPTIFRSSDICIINKIDLLPYVEFSIDKAKEYALRINHHLTFFEVSVKTGEGLENWFNWLKNIK